MVAIARLVTRIGKHFFRSGEGALFRTSLRFAMLRFSHRLSRSRLRAGFGLRWLRLSLWWTGLRRSSLGLSRLRTIDLVPNRRSAELLNLMFNIEVTVVFWIQESLVRLVDFASLALMLQDPASLFSQRLLLLPAQLILLSFSVRVEERLDLVLMVMQIQLLLAHVWVSNLELNELIIAVSLLLLDITLPLWESHLVLPATIVNIGRFIVLLLMHFSVILRRGFRLGWFLLFAAFAWTWALSFALVFTLVFALTLALTLWSRLL